MRFSKKFTMKPPKHGKLILLRSFRQNLWRDLRSLDESIEIHVQKALQYRKQFVRLKQGTIEQLCNEHHPRLHLGELDYAARLKELNKKDKPEDKEVTYASLSSSEIPKTPEKVKSVVNTDALNKVNDDEHEEEISDSTDKKNKIIE